MDDMLIATTDDPAFHKQCIHKILDKLEKHDLYLKPEKCTFTQKHIEFLGVVLENNTIQMDPTKIKGVAEWPCLRSPTDVRSFLGFTGFYRYFIPNYSRIARPLLDLTKKATPWVWTEAQMTAFEMLKKLMCYNQSSGLPQTIFFSLAPLYYLTTLFHPVPQSYSHPPMLYSALLLFIFVHRFASIVSYG